MESLWFFDPVNFMTADNFYKIIPMPDQSVEAQLNALMRFAIYYSAVLMVVKQSIQPVFFSVFVGLMSLGITYYTKMIRVSEAMTLDAQNLVRDPRKRDVCVKPTRSNPFMNVSYNDYKENADRPRACDITQKPTQRKVEALYEDTLVFDSDDIFKRNSTSRQFYTNPSTTIPNDQESFAKWLYGVPERTCKEGKCEVAYRTIQQ